MVTEAAILLCLEIVAQPGYGYTLGSVEMASIGYTPDKRGWPLYTGIVREAMLRLEEAGIDPRNQQEVLQRRRALRSGSSCR